MSLNYSPGFRGCEKLAVKVTHNGYGRGIRLHIQELEKARPKGRAFLEHYCLFFLFFTLANCILQIACQIVRITLGLVELAFGLHLLVARDLASGVLNRALALSAAPLTCSRSMYDSCVGLVYRQRAGASGRSIKRKNAASGGTMCATKNLVCVPNSRRREQQNQESRYC